MYDVISDIINHTWVSQGAGEQQYIYYTASAIIILFTIVVIDLIYRVFRHFWRA